MPTVTISEFYAGTQFSEEILKPVSDRPEWMRHAQTSDQAAAELLNAVHARKHFVPFSPRGRFMVFTQRHAPWLLDRMTSRGE